MSKLRSSVVVSLAILAAFIGRIAQAAVNTSAVAPEFIKNSALAWYDAADGSTITADANGVVSAWADKSSNNRTATPRTDTSFWSAPVRTTAFGCPCLDFGCVGSRCDLVYERMTTIRTVFLVGRFGQDEHVFLLDDGRRVKVAFPNASSPNGFTNGWFKAEVFHLVCCVDGGHTVFGRPMLRRLVLLQEHGPFTNDQYFTRMNELLGEAPYQEGLRWTNATHPLLVLGNGNGGCAALSADFDVMNVDRHA